MKSGSEECASPVVLLTKIGFHLRRSSVYKRHMFFSNVPQIIEDTKTD